MSNHSNNVESKSFILPIFLSFATVFCFVMLMKCWHGNYAPIVDHATEHAEQHAPEAHEPHSEH